MLTIDDDQLKKAGRTFLLVNIDGQRHRLPFSRSTAGRPFHHAPLSLVNEMQYLILEKVCKVFLNFGYLDENSGKNDGTNCSDKPKAKSFLRLVVKVMELPFTLATPNSNNSFQINTFYCNY